MSPLTTLPPRKNCTRCTRWRHITDFSPRKWDEHGRCLKVQSHCNACRKGYHKKWWRTLTPERREHWREYNREQQTIHSRRHGVQPRPVGKLNKGEYGGGRLREHGPPNATPDAYLPTQPFQSYLENILGNASRYRLAGDKAGTDDGIQLLADWTGVSERLIRRVRSGESEWVAVDAVERIIEHSDYTMYDITEAAREWAEIQGIDVRFLDVLK